MARRGNPIVLLGLCLSLSLSISLFATGCSKTPRDSEYRVLVDIVTNPPGASFLGPGRTPHRTPAQIAIRDGSLSSFPSDPASVELDDLSCKSPIGLPQDCGGRMRVAPTRRLRVRGLDVRVAGSATGEEVLVFHDDVNPVALGVFPNTYGPDACTRVLRETVPYGPQLRHVTALKSGGVTHGCYLEFDGNVYDSLKALTIVE